MGDRFTVRNVLSQCPQILEILLLASELGDKVTLVTLAKELLCPAPNNTERFSENHFSAH